MARITRFLRSILRPKRASPPSKPKISAPIPLAPREPTPDMPFPSAKDPFTHHTRHLSPGTPAIQVASPLQSPTLTSPPLSPYPYTHTNTSFTALLAPTSPSPNSATLPARSRTTRASARHSKAARRQSYFGQFASTPGGAVGAGEKMNLSPSERFSRSYVVVAGEEEARIAEKKRVRLSRRVSLGLQTYETHGRVYAP